MTAAEEGAIDMLYKEIRLDPEISEAFDNILRDTPLHEAACKGHTRFVLEIMNLKPSLARKLNFDGYSPMHLALRNGQTKTVMELLSIDARLVRIKGKGGVTPLHYVAEQGDIKMVEILLESCPKAIGDVTAQGETAMHVALKNDKIEAFFAMSNLPQWMHLEKFYYWRKRILNWKDINGNTLLHIAASRNQDQVIRFLLNFKVDVNAENEEGDTALDICRHQAQTQSIDWLREAGGVDGIRRGGYMANQFLRVHQRLNKAATDDDIDELYALIWEDEFVLENIEQTPFAHTPLHIAACRGHIKFAKEIIKLQPTFIRKRNQSGLNPMHLALQCKQTNMVCYLVEVDRHLVHIEGDDGKTPLHYVTEEGDEYILSKFLAACPDSVRVLTFKNETVVHLAVKKGNLAVLTMLLGWSYHAGLDHILDLKDDEGNTVLHIATSKNDVQMVRQLSKRVDVNIKNLEGLTALDILDNQVEQGQIAAETSREIRAILLKASAKRGSSLPNEETLADFLRKRLSWAERWTYLNLYSAKFLGNENRNALLVVAVLIATVNCQMLGLDIDIIGADEGPRALKWPVRVVKKYAFPLFLLCNSVAFILACFDMANLLPNGIARTPSLILLFICYNLYMIVKYPLIASIFILFMTVLICLWVKETKIRHQVYKRSSRMMHIIFKHCTRVGKYDMSYETPSGCLGSGSG